ncbi:MAG: molybdate ABC transporter substrate-binding protein [Gallionellaceae bacterium]|jgi:molybdate transport system substrate-binding protein
MLISMRGFIAALVMLPGLMSTPVFAGEVRVAVASNFAAPMENIAALFKQESGHTLKVTSASSGKLYTQISSGTAFDVFLSADEEMPKRLIRDGAAVGGSRFVYATGRLALWSAQTDFVDDKGAVLNKGNFDKLAIPNPRFSPYGIAAKETLEKLTMWNAVQRKLTKGEDVVQTYQMAATEKVDLAIIALSQIMRDGNIAGGSWWLVPSVMHNPIRQSAVLLSGAKDSTAALAFLAFLKSDKAKKVIFSFGYEVP